MADPATVTQWMRTQLAIVRAERVNPPLATRIAAYGALALYEGFAAPAASPLRSLGGQLNGLGALPTSRARLDGASVAIAAERTVMAALLEAGFASTRRAVDTLASAQLAARVRAGVPQVVHDSSVALGQRIGEALVAWAAVDSFAATRGRPYAPPTGRGVWVNTSTPDQHLPAALSGESDIVLERNAGNATDYERAATRELFMNRPKARGPSTLGALDPSKPTEPYWGRLRPFALAHADACPIAPPPPYSEQPGSPFHIMAKAVYDTVRALTPAQKATALFWADNAAMTGTPGFHWMAVMSQMVSRRGLSAEQAAEMLALTTVSIADAFIATWREKYRSNVVRPVTYVQRVFDPRFTTVVITPPFPEYPSGHSTQSGAAVRVLTRLLGDTIAFVDSTQVDIGYAPRAFASFSAARDEVAISRLYGGIHFLPAITEGVTMGECIGDAVLTRLRTRR
ncbi:MAG: vanadium-dependent haloperoxidase [Gemmatimonadaceae bacterium]|nr:vanadium-dependent haloperoxidase [Gemmatimonadaceae bacterium]